MDFKMYLSRSFIFFDGVKLYLDIIEKSMENIGCGVSRVHDVGQINKDDVVLTIGHYDFFPVWKKSRNIIHWVQGIAPEETLANDKSSINKYRRYLQYRFMEWFILRKASFLLFVSEDMLRHYQRIYKYRGKNYAIVPCFNMVLDKSSFCQEKYQTPSFVYTGNLSGWQCFPETVDMFKKIKCLLPNANLTIYTKDQEDAKRILKEKGVSADVKYLPAEELAGELKKYKYGFLIRDNIEVNKVATPIKMNTYLANGIIPVFSDVIGAFHDHIGALKYSVPIDESRKISKIIELENTDILATDVYNEYEVIFREYYSPSFYVNMLSSKFKAILCI